MIRTTHNTRGVLRLSAVVFALAAGVTLAASQTRPGPDGVRDERDPVTGYLCAGTCDVVRIPEANCLCVKDNPAETRADQVRLRCTTRERGAWVACPVKPRIGITLDFRE